MCNGFNLILKASVTNCLPNESAHSLNCDEFYNKLSDKQALCRQPNADKVSTDVDEHILSWNNVTANIENVELKWPRVDKSSNASTVNNQCQSPGRQYQHPVKSLRKHRKVRTSYSSDSKEKDVRSDADVIDIEVVVWDTGGDKMFTWLHWFECTGADAVLVCVPLSTMLPLNKVELGSKCRASRDLQKFMEDEMLSKKAKSRTANYRVPPILLVGTKSDLCTEREKGENLLASTKAINHGLKEVCNYNQAIDRNGLKFAREIDACDFISCSAMYEADGAKVFERALEIALTSEGEYRASKELNESTDSLNAQPSYFDANLYGDRLVTSTPAKKNGNREMGIMDNLTIPRNDRKSNGDSAGDLLEKTAGVMDEDETMLKSSNGNLNSTVPCISFPPPPSLSPPSTCPPSSDLSSSYSSSSSSLESLCDSSPDLPRPDSSPNTNEDIAENMKYEEYEVAYVQKSAPPIPIPRKLKKTCAVHSSGELKNRDEINFDESVILSSNCIVVKPRPTRRCIKRDDPSIINRSRKTSEVEKFDKVFVKFLKS